MITKQRNVFFLIIIACMAVQSAVGMNLFEPYNPLLRPYYTAQTKGTLTFYAEKGVGSRSYNSDGASVNALHIFQSTQSALAMLQGFPEDSAIGKLRTALDATDDGTRGHMCPTGHLDLRADAAIAARYSFCTDWAIAAYLAYYDMILKDVSWVDQTQDITTEDIRTKELLTDKLFEVVNQLGNGLELNRWHRHGFGDVTVLLEWFKDFKQNKPLLKNARVNWRTGLIVPTGKKEDEDKLFALPFGRDGAWALPFEVGLDLTVGCNFKVGLDVLLIHTFGNTRCRRIKTDVSQTDFLLLAKTKAYKDFGMFQQFSLYAQLFQLYKGASFLLGYQYIKQGQSELSLYSNDFSTAIANTAVSLQDRTMHQIFVRADYDWVVHMDNCAPIIPQLSLFARIPFNGKRATMTPTVGLGLTLNF
jgi:hypothetical protein